MHSSLHAQVPTAPAADGPKKSGWGDSPGAPDPDAAPKPGRRRRGAADADDEEEPVEAPVQQTISSMDDEDIDMEDSDSEFSEFASFSKIPR